MVLSEEQIVQSLFYIVNMPLKKVTITLSTTQTLKLWWLTDHCLQKIKFLSQNLAVVVPDLITTYKNLFLHSSRQDINVAPEFNKKDAVYFHLQYDAQ